MSLTFALARSSKRPGKDDSPKIIEETRQYIRDFDRVAGTTKAARELYDQMLSLSKNAAQLTQRMNENQEKLSQRFLSLASSIDSLTERLQHGEGTAAQLLNSGELHKRLVSSTARLDSMLTVIESGRGSLGRLYADSTLYDDTRALVSSMKRLMAEIEKNPKKYFKFSLF